MFEQECSRPLNAQLSLEEARSASYARMDSSYAAGNGCSGARE